MFPFADTIGEGFAVGETEGVDVGAAELVAVTAGVAVDVDLGDGTTTGAPPQAASSSAQTAALAAPLFTRVMVTRATTRDGSARLPRGPAGHGRARSCPLLRLPPPLPRRRAARGAPGRER